MSGLNLIPSVPIVVAEAGFFIANLFLVKHLFVSPYLKLKDARGVLTQGREELARKMLADSQAKQREVEIARKKVREDLTLLWDEAKREVTAKRDEIVEKAQSQASQEISSAMKELSLALAREQAKVEKESSELAQVICDKLLV